MMLLDNHDRSRNQIRCYLRKSNEVSVMFMKNNNGREQQDVQSQGSDIHMPIINGGLGSGRSSAEPEKTGERC